MRKPKRWLISVIASVSGLLIAVLGLIAAGIIGNGAYALLGLLWTSEHVVVWEQMLKTLKLITMNFWLLSTIFLLVISIILLVILKKQNNALNMMSEIATFDTVLLHCLAGLAAGRDREQKEQQMKKILRVLLKNAMSSQAAAGLVFRASILLPNAENPEYLTIWAGHEMPLENIQRTAFYIGDDMNKVPGERGVAGETYKDGKTRIAHMVKKEGKWVCEYPSYRTFENRKYIPYEAFVSEPIVKVTLNRSGEHQRKVIGVVCFDSHKKWIFDHPKTQKLLKSLGERLGAVISLYWELE